jgi:dihydrofolate reductase
MRKIVILEFISLDGVMQAIGTPEEDTSGGFEYGGWTVPYADEFMNEVMRDQMTKPFELLLGRRTFEIFAYYWPKNEDKWPGINSVTKYVASKSLTKHEWNNSVFLKGDVVNDIKKLKEQDGPDLQVYGSGNFIQTLLRYDLVDELWLKIFPITLGKGKKLFTEGTIPASWKLIDSKVSPQGVFVANYKREGEVKTGSFG